MRTARHGPPPPSPLPASAPPPPPEAIEPIALANSNCRTGRIELVQVLPDTYGAEVASLLERGLLAQLGAKIENSLRDGRDYLVRHCGVRSEVCPEPFAPATLLRAGAEVFLLDPEAAEVGEYVAPTCLAGDVAPTGRWAETPTGKRFQRGIYAWCRRS